MRKGVSYYVIIISIIAGFLGYAIGFAIAFGAFLPLLFTYINNVNIKHDTERGVRFDD